MKRKDMIRTKWTRILRKDVVIRDTALPDGRRGKAGLIAIRKVQQPLVIRYGDRSVTIADGGYTWVQVAPEGAYYWITAMFDGDGRPVEIYVDLTDGNHTEEEDPWFDDLYLDYVFTGDRVLELDRDELDEACARGEITRYQYERTLREGEKVFRLLTERRDELEAFLARQRERLLGEVTEQNQKEENHWG